MASLPIGVMYEGVLGVIQNRAGYDKKILCGML